jgi:chemotaxis protein methyltransferase CheR
MTMTDNKYVLFLQWALPQLGLRWRGFRKVRRQVSKRIAKRITELELTGLTSYKKYLLDNVEEWSVLDHCCRITISRFYRDKVIFDYLGSDILPALALSLKEQKVETMRIWSAGCASGEEAYTIAILWHFLILPKFPDLSLEIIASDIDPIVINRAKAACYSMSSLKNLPARWLKDAFDNKNGLYCLKKAFKKYVHFCLVDIRRQVPDGLFHAVFCRNLAFTYFDLPLQRKATDTFHQKLTPGGLLITGTHEQLPRESKGYTPWVIHMPIYQKLEM